MYVAIIYDLQNQKAEVLHDGMADDGSNQQ